MRHRTLDRRPVTLLVLCAVMAATAIMYMTTQRELAPEEDQGILFNIVKAPQSANLDYLEQATAQLGKLFDAASDKKSDPTLLFFDEFDALAIKRRTASTLSRSPES